MECAHVLWSELTCDAKVGARFVEAVLALRGEGVVEQLLHARLARGRREREQHHARAGRDAVSRGEDGEVHARVCDRGASDKISAPQISRDGYGCTRWLRVVTRVEERL